MWHTYIIRCSDGTLYTGVTNNIEDRLRRHNDGSGSKYTRARRPVELLYIEDFSNRSTAQIRESEIKSLSREDKESLIKFGVDSSLLE